MSQTLDDVRRLSREQFAAKYPYRFLVHEDFHMKPAALARDSSWDLMTREVDLARRSLFQQVFAIRKRQALFADMITIGRTANHDIVVTDPRVSKFHAWFRADPDQLLVADAGSKNGTFVDGVRLSARELQPVRSSARLYLGVLRFLVLDAAACHRFLRRS